MVKKGRRTSGEDPAEVFGGKRPVKGQAIKRYTPVEVAEHLRIVQDAWIEGASDREIKRILEQSGHKVGLNRVLLLRNRIEERIAAETESARPYSKARQTRRITRAIRDTKGQRAKDGKGWITKPDHAARVAYENMIAKIEGNYEPLKIEVDAVHRHALVEVMAGLSDDQWEQHVQAFDRMRELAESKARENGEQLDDLLPRPPLMVSASMHSPASRVNGKANGHS